MIKNKITGSIIAISAKTILPNANFCNRNKTPHTDRLKNIIPEINNALLKNLLLGVVYIKISTINGKTKNGITNCEYKIDFILFVLNS